MIPANACCHALWHAERPGNDVRQRAGDAGSVQQLRSHPDFAAFHSPGFWRTVRASAQPRAVAY